MAAVVIVSIGASASGCQSPSAPFDPFLAGRTTIPPPSTAAAPAAAAPYYPAAPAADAPPTIYTPPGSTPAAVPATQNYLPRSGMSFPQSQASPAPGNTTLASTAAPSISSSNATSIAPATQPASAAVDSTVKQASFSRADVPSSPPSVVRIPTQQAAAPNQLPPNGAAQPLASALRSADQRAAAAQLPELGDFPRPTAVTNGGFRANTSPPAARATNATAAAQAPGAKPPQPASPVASSTPSTNVPGYGYDEKYQRLQGKLEFSQSQQRWKLRYIPIDGETDTFGGSVVLPESEKLNGFTAGDFVVVQGRLNTARGPADGFSPPYLIERVARQ
jgi:hypothetical protein